MLTSLRNWLRGWTLRGRLVAGLLTLLALVLLGIGAVSTVAVREFLTHQLDESLGTAAQRAENQVHRFDQGGPQPGIDPFPAGQAVGTVTMIVLPDGIFLPNGSRFIAYRLTGDVGYPDAPTRVQLTQAQGTALLAVPAGGVPQTSTLDGLGDYRIVARQVRSSYGTYTVITGLPLKQVTETVGQLVFIELAVGGGALVFAAGAGAFLIGGALHPLRRVAATARRVAELPLAQGEVDLSERVPPEHTDPRTEVGQVGAALNRMLGHVGDALAARHASETRVRQFVADASHELRTPLAAIRGYAELTRRQPVSHATVRYGANDVPEEVAHALTRIEAESHRMTGLVEDMLLLARLDSGPSLERAPVPLSELVVDAVGDAHAAGPDHKWRLELPDEPVTVQGDRARLQQVLGNLLANARVHTPAGTAVTTQLWVRDGVAVLTVADDGPGIPEGVRGEIFGRFVRGDSSRSRAAGSTGLGLAIVAAVVEAHQGHVDVTSRPGNTIFTVSLPHAALG